MSAIDTELLSLPALLLLIMINIGRGTEVIMLCGSHIILPAAEKDKGADRHRTPR